MCSIKESMKKNTKVELFSLLMNIQVECSEFLGLSKFFFKVKAYARTRLFQNIHVRWNNLGQNQPNFYNRKNGLGRTDGPLDISVCRNDSPMEGPDGPTVGTGWSNSLDFDLLSNFFNPKPFNMRKYSNEKNNFEISLHYIQ